MQLTSYQQEQLKKVTGVIVNTALPEKIFLLGISYRHCFEHTIFTGNGAVQLPVQQVARYQLLVLTKAENKTSLDEVQDLIESRCGQLATPVSIYRESISIFNGWLQSGHPFACHVYRNGQLLYDAGSTPFVEPGAVMPLNVLRECGRWDNLVTELLAGADLFRLRRQFPLAAFFLHQAAEQALTFCIKISTGYRVVSHNLEKLLRYARPFCMELEDWFDRNREQGLFKLLQQAYIDSRYKEEFSIKEKEVTILTERVKLLQQLVRKVVNQLPGLN